MGQLCPLNTSTTKKRTVCRWSFQHAIATQQLQQNSCSSSEETKQYNGNCHTVSYKITQSVTKSHPVSHKITPNQSQNHTQSVTKSHPVSHKITPVTKTKLGFVQGYRTLKVKTAQTSEQKMEMNMGWNLGSQKVVNGKAWTASELRTTTLNTEQRGEPAGRKPRGSPWQRWRECPPWHFSFGWTERTLFWGSWKAMTVTGDKAVFMLLW